MCSSLPERAYLDAVVNTCGCAWTCLPVHHVTVTPQGDTHVDRRHKATLVTGDCARKNKHRHISDREREREQGDTSNFKPTVNSNYPERERETICGGDNTRSGLMLFFLTEGL